MSDDHKTIKLDIPKTAEEREARRIDSIISDANTMAIGLGKMFKDSSAAKLWREMADALAASRAKLAEVEKERDALKECADKLEFRKIHLSKSLDDAERQRDFALAALEVAKGALAFYEAPYEWMAARGEDPIVPDFWDEIDFGERARAALARIKQEKGDDE